MPNLLPNLVIVSSGRERWLADTRRRIRIEPPRQVDSQELVQAVMIELLQQHPGATSIELVSHSLGDPGEHENLMKFGTWILDAASVARFSNELRDLVRGKILRLVGCSTALGRPAFQTLWALKERLGVVAQGTMRDVGIYDFDEQGSKVALRTGLFASPDQVQPRRRSFESLAKSHAVPLAASSMSEATRVALLSDLDGTSHGLADRVLAALASSSMLDFPGLLSLPSETRELLNDRNQPVGQIDYLFGGEAIRFIRFEGDLTSADLLFYLGADPARRRQLLQILRGS